MIQSTLHYIETCANEREHGSVQKLDCGDVRLLLKERENLLHALESMTSLAYKLAMQSPVLNPEVDKLIPIARSTLAKSHS